MLFKCFDDTLFNIINDLMASSPSFVSFDKMNVISTKSLRDFFMKSSTHLEELIFTFFRFNFYYIKSIGTIGLVFIIAIVVAKVLFRIRKALFCHNIFYFFCLVKAEAIGAISARLSSLPKNVRSRGTTPIVFYEQRAFLLTIEK